ncbi:MAG: hypothetical protein JO255_16655 [Alphaproteobacteria bacterium]|nr:hypothetical protein [Alphaproteobacteria bacterium]
MTEFFESRRLRYEIHKLCDKRWQLAEIVNDGREGHQGHYGRKEFEEVEKNVLGRANALLSAGQVQAVKVLRERQRADGFTTTSEIFFKESTGRTEAPATVSQYDGPIAVCEAPGDLYGRSACKAIGVMLRTYLDKQFITALELLHFQPYMRKLSDESYYLVQGVLHQVSTAQARASGGDAKGRTEVLLGLLEAIETKARNAMAEKGLPAIEGGDLKGFVERIAARYEGDDRRFYTVVGIARQFQGMQSFQGRLDFVLDQLEAGQSAETRQLLDELAAGCLDSSQLVMDLLGHKPNLAAALVALSDLAGGRGGGGGPEDPGGTVPRLREQIARGALPLAVDTLWDRILRELARGRPLSKTDDKQEWGLLMKTSDRLLADCPADRKTAISDHFKTRLRRIRDAAVMRE